LKEEAVKDEIWLVSIRTHWVFCRSFLPNDNTSVRGISGNKNIVVSAFLKLYLFSEGIRRRRRRTVSKFPL